MRLVSNVTDVFPILLNSKSTIPEVGDAMKAYGYGRTGDGSPATELRVGDFESISNEDCRERTYGIGNANITDDILCADPIGLGGGEGGETVAASICQGDSGSPLIDVESGTLVGIVSFNFKCVADSFPGKDDTLRLSLQTHIDSGSYYSLTELFID